MNQRDHFSGGFVLGAIVGGIVGGILGAVVASRQLSTDSEEALLPGNRTDRREGKKKAQPLKALNEQNIEAARRSLEDKIAQLNEAIDDVRQQLGPVNGAGHLEQEEPPILRDP